MYIIQNAWKSIVRNKGRNILIGIIALVIAVSACVALSIREAAETAKEETLAGMSVTAQISYDRTSAMSDMRESFGDDGFDRENFDFESFTGNTLSLEDYMTYTEALSDGDSYYYSMTASLNAAEDLMPYGENESAEEDSQDNENTPPEGMPGMGGGGRELFDFSARGDFSLTGYSSYSAMLSLFGEDGTYSVTEGQMFEESSSDMVCVVSDELAIYNDLAVGDTITLANPNYEDETYTLTVCGIYTNTASDTGSSQFAFSDPTNNIYLSYDALSAIIDASGEAGNVMTEESREERSAALTSEINFTYVFPTVENYNNFETAVRELGLSEAYTITSPDLTSFENSLKPLNTLSTAAGWFFLIVLAIGGIILIVLNIFNLRERKYEVGVLTAIGMKKHKVAIQFVYELFSVCLLYTSPPAADQFWRRRTVLRKNSSTMPSA